MVPSACSIPHPSGSLENVQTQHGLHDCSGECRACSFSQAGRMTGLRPQPSARARKGIKSRIQSDVCNTITSPLLWGGLAKETWAGGGVQCSGFGVEGIVRLVVGDHDGSCFTLQFKAAAAAARTPWLASKLHDSVTIRCCCVGPCKSGTSLRTGSERERERESLQLRNSACCDLLACIQGSSYIIAVHAECATPTKQALWGPASHLHQPNDAKVLGRRKGTV